MESPPLFLMEERIKTYTNWPFSDKQKCNVLRMAEAGFYSIATGADDAYAAKCFLCGKEVYGWEADNDPWAEHKSHAPECAYVQIGKKEDDLTLTEFLSIVRQYMHNEIEKFAECCEEEIDKNASTILTRFIGSK